MKARIKNPVFIVPGAMEALHIFAGLSEEWKASDGILFILVAVLKPSVEDIKVLLNLSVATKEGLDTSIMLGSSLSVALLIEPLEPSNEESTFCWHKTGRQNWTSRR